MNIAAILDGEAPEPLRPTILQRADGQSLFYSGQVNLIFGDPEAGKTWVCLAAVASELTAGRRALMIDLDHNGAVAVLGHLLKLGVLPETLKENFRYSEPESPQIFRQVVEDVSTWQPSIVIVDSLGELIPLFSSSSNSPDEVTDVHRRTLKPMAKSGAAVIAVDHRPKSEQARNRIDPGGTVAKSRVLGGCSISVTVTRQFRPGHGGACDLVVAKDRHGGVRAHCSSAKRQSAGTFELTDHENGSLSWLITPPAEVASSEATEHASDVVASKVEEILAAAERTNAPPRLGRDALKKYLSDYEDPVSAGNAAYAEAVRRRKAVRGGAV
ncbi:AAA family ATPase [Rhodococcus sp. SJ-3]|uniref:AAA family ATPase n=1 Tax=Rhodococcus sp. SJ-3 TaxID=3454628 RepID=UPI003F7A784A